MADPTRALVAAGAAASLTATMPEPRDGAAVRFPPPALPVIAIGLAWWLNRTWPIELAGVTDWWGWTWIGAVIVVVGFSIGAWAIVLFRRSGQDPNPWKPSPALVEHGPYRVTRNPMYVQLVGICFGLAVWLTNVWLLLLTPMVGVALDRLVIRYEEEYLERKFGDRYSAYKARVRRWL